MSREDWNESAAQRRARILQQIGPAGDSADRTLWTVTMQERDAGWLSDPLQLTDARKQLGAHYVPAKRFLVVQKGKDRPVDDYTISGANALIKVCEKPYMQSLDVLVAQARLLQFRLQETSSNTEICG
eukprot:416287-Amphidinium_carterae.1